MLYIVLLLGILFGITYSKPLSSCSSQMSCMELGITEQDALDSDGNKQYELCLIFNPSRDECSKEGEISHACPSEMEEDKIEGWGEGERMCNIVSCDNTAYFGVKDGSTCDGNSIYGDMGLPGYDEYIYCYSVDDDSYSGGSCGGNKKNKKTKQCRYVIPAPKCDDDDTTTSAPDTTTSTPDVTTTSQACECSMEWEDEGFNDECNAKCYGECMSTSPGPDAQCVLTDPSPSASNVYVRDKNGDNSNLNFVIDTDQDTDTESINAANNKNYYLLSIFVAIIVYLI